MKRLLCVVSRPPYAGTHNIELLETALVGAVFDLDVTVLFRDEGVWALQAGQDTNFIAQRSVEKVLGALPTYEITRVVACAQSVADKHLSAAQMEFEVTLLSHAEQATLIAEQDVVIGAQA